MCEISLQGSQRVLKNDKKNFNRGYHIVICASGCNVSVHKT